MKTCERRYVGAGLALIAACSTACGDDTRDRSFSGASGAGGDPDAGATTSVTSAAASSGAGGSQTTTGSLEFSWLVDRGENCQPGTVVTMGLSGPTGVNEDIPCDSYGHLVKDLVSGSYTMNLQLDDGSQTTVIDLNPFGIGAGPLVFAEPFDLGKCSLGGCGTQSIGCVDDGKCTEDDDCVCADCDTDHYCNTGFPRNCDDGVCEPYYEGCSCPDCMQEPICAG